jgi:flavin-dependent dehydrogenase
VATVPAAFFPPTSFPNDPLPPNNNDHAQGKVVRGRVLVCADGSTSRLATQLGYCVAPPQGVSSRAYIEGGTHNADFDGLVFYPRWSLPG